MFCKEIKREKNNMGMFYKEMVSLKITGEYNYFAVCFSLHNLIIKVFLNMVYKLMN